MTSTPMTQGTSPINASKKYRNKLALQIVKRERQRWADWDAKVAAWYRDPSSKGYRFPECPHGHSTWVDYDVICGSCEDGDTFFDYPRVLKEAMYEAITRIAESERRQAMVHFEHNGHTILRDVNLSTRYRELGSQLLDWVFAPLNTDRSNY